MNNPTLVKSPFYPGLIVILCGVFAGVILLLMLRHIFGLAELLDVWGAFTGHLYTLSYIINGIDPLLVRWLPLSIVVGIAFHFLRWRRKGAALVKEHLIVVAQERERKIADWTKSVYEGRVQVLRELNIRIQRPPLIVPYLMSLLCLCSFWLTCIGGVRSNIAIVFLVLFLASNFILALFFFGLCRCLANTPLGLLFDNEICEFIKVHEPPRGVLPNPSKESVS